MTKAATLAAAIDLGTNSFRLLIASNKDGRLDYLENRLETVRLGKGLHKTSVLEEPILQHAYEVLTEFRQLLDKYPVKQVRVCGTEALRLAKNKQPFLEKAETILSSPVRLINGDEEAFLTLNGVSLQMKLDVKPFLLADVGGGSTELIYGMPSKKPKTVSLGIGAMILTEIFSGSENDVPESLQKMTQHIERILPKRLNNFTDCSAKTIIGSGGTATAMAAIHLGLSTYDRHKVQGAIMNDRQIAHLFQRLVTLSPEKRNSLCGLEKGRGNIILAGIKIFQILMSRFNCNELQISDAGLLEGILLSALPDSVTLKNYIFFKQESPIKG